MSNHALHAILSGDEEFIHQPEDDYESFVTVWIYSVFLQWFIANPDRKDTRDYDLMRNTFDDLFGAAAVQTVYSQKAVLFQAIKLVLLHRDLSGAAQEPIRAVYKDLMERWQMTVALADSFSATKDELLIAFEAALNAAR